MIFTSVAGSLSLDTVVLRYKSLVSHYCQGRCRFIHFEFEIKIAIEIDKTGRSYDHLYGDKAGSEVRQMLPRASVAVNRLNTGLRHPRPVTVSGAPRRAFFVPFHFHFPRTVAPSAPPPFSLSHSPLPLSPPLPPGPAFLIDSFSPFLSLSQKQVQNLLSTLYPRNSRSQCCSYPSPQISITLFDAHLSRLEHRLHLVPFVPFFSQEPIVALFRQSQPVCPSGWSAAIDRPAAWNTPYILPTQLKDYSSQFSPVEPSGTVLYITNNQLVHSCLPATSLAGLLQAISLSEKIVLQPNQTTSSCEK